MSVRVGIVGGGMAGLAAAAFLKREKDLGADVCYTILEKGDRPGRKLLMTGHGRCNITNRKAPAKLKEGYHEAGSYIYKALKAFDPDNAAEFFESVLGVPLKEEDNNLRAIKLRRSLMLLQNMSAATISSPALTALISISWMITQTLRQRTDVMRLSMS